MPLRKIRRFGQTFFRREQTIFVFNGKYVIVAKHAQCEINSLHIRPGRIHSCGRSSALASRVYGLYRARRYGRFAA